MAAILSQSQCVKSLHILFICTRKKYISWDHSGYGFSQWKDALPCNASSHWLCPHQNDSCISSLSSWTKDVQVWRYKTRILVSLLFVLHIIAMPMSIIKSLTSPLFAQQFVHAINKENIQIPYYWPHVRGIPQWLVDSPHKGPVMRTSGSMESIIMCQHALRKLRPQQNCNFADNIFFYWTCWI